MPVDMNGLLTAAAVATSHFLNATLPALSKDDWWERRVLQFLSDGQRNAVNRNGITQLSQLDLASLLHTLDNNWRSLDDIHGFAPGSLNFVKEMRTVRNRWSHQSAVPDYTPDDVYRDLDTLERFLAVVEAESDLQEKARAERLAIIAEILKAHSYSVAEQTASEEAAAAPVSTSEKPATPSCPICGNAMILRTARTGSYAGNQFWGCSEWSVNGCNGIVNIPKPQDQDSETAQPPACPNCQSTMVLRTARAGPYAGSQFWGCSEWGITGCNGLINIADEPTADDVDDLPF